MNDTFIVDLRHYVGEGGGFADMPPAALNLALFLGSIVGWVTSHEGRLSLTNVPCRRSPARKRCRGTIVAGNEGDGAIIWHCPVCRDLGIISGWEDTRWDRRPARQPGAAEAPDRSTGDGCAPTAPTRALPASPGEWFREVRDAYADAQEAIPVGAIMGAEIREAELFHMAALIALKFRGLPFQEDTLAAATDAALGSYVANLDNAAARLGDPRLDFAFCYLASHFGLDLIDDLKAQAAMDYIERHLPRWDAA